MIYDYNMYYRQNCLVPLFIIVFCSPGLIIAVVSFIKNCRSHSVEGVLKAAFVASIFLFLIIGNVIPLVRGGIYLLFEKENDAIQLSGQIEKTIELAHYGGGRYGSTENNHGYGEAIVVNGETYYLTTYYDFKVGDNVVIDVLPRSRIVLRLELQGMNAGDG